MGLLYYAAGTLIATFLIWMWIEKQGSYPSYLRKNIFWLLPDFRYLSARWDFITWSLKKIWALVPLTIGFYVGVYEGARHVLADGGWYQSHWQGWIASQSPAAVRIEGFVLAVLSYDFTLYWAHRLYHHKWLWPFHEIHHYGRQMNYFAAQRQHPLDLVNFFSAIVMALSLALFLPENAATVRDMTSWQYVFDHFQIPFLVSLFLLVIPGLQHSYVYLRYPRPLNWILVSPVMHHVHHSNLIWNKNFGGLLCVWDRLFGTHHEVTSFEEFRRHSQNLGCGVDEAEYNSLKDIYWKPVKKAWILFRGSEVETMASTPVSLSERDAPVELS